LNKKKQEGRADGGYDGPVGVYGRKCQIID